MTEVDVTAVPRTEAGVRSWLVQRVAHYVELPVEEIDVDASVASYGLDSVYAFALCGEIEDALGLSVEPTLIWDVDTVAALTTHLMSCLAQVSTPDRQT